MSKWNDWRELKYQIADRLFAKELDDAYHMGLRYGTEYSTRTLLFHVKLEREKKGLTPAQRVGYEKAIARMEELRKVIKQKTGAYLP